MYEVKPGAENAKGAAAHAMERSSHVIIALGLVGVFLMC